MSTNDDIKKLAKRVLSLEARAIKEVIPRVGDEFQKAVNVLSELKGKVIVLGIGKSGIVARKIASTFSLTGTPAIYLHPVESLHGDIGVVSKYDVILAISYSGETDEIIKTLPLLKHFGVKIIAFTGNTKSTLAKNSDIVINVKVSSEACPYNIVPTSSTTVCAAVGDALAICVMKKRGIGKEHFILSHPSGSIGNKLLLKVGDIMRTGADNPIVSPEAALPEALLVMTRTRLGAVSVVDKQGKLVGYFTDGDLRRWLQRGGSSVLNKKIKDLMTKNPVTITKDKMAVEAAILLREKNCDNLPVVDEKNCVIGIIDERDLIAKGIM